MNIVVLMKQTFHTEEKIYIENNRILEDDAEFIINPYDEYAVEEAVKLKEEFGGEVTVVTFGPPRAESALRTAMAMGADKAVLVDSESFEPAADEYSVSIILASVVKKLPYDIILSGNMAVDGGSAQIGPRVAEELGIPHITAITKLEFQNPKLVVERDVEGDIETVESMVPVLLTTQQGLNEPRYPSMIGIVKAKKKPLDFVSASDLPSDADAFKAKTVATDIYPTAPKKAGQILSGPLNEQVKQLVRFLHQEGKSSETCLKSFESRSNSAGKILVFAEVKGGKLRNVSLEAIAAAKKAYAEGEIIAVLIGHEDMTSYAESLAYYGADQVYMVRDPKLEWYTCDTYSQAFTSLIEEVLPNAIFMGHTAIGKDLAPRIAARLQLGLVSDCVQLDTEGDHLLFVRPIYAGKAYEKRRINEGTVFATIRPNNFAIERSDSNRTANFVHYPARIEETRTVVKGIAKKTSGSIDLTEAKIVVSGGRGLKSENGFKPLYKLAEVLEAAVGASRGACDANYCNYAMQIGQTGKVVTPDLYIACGISGAIQHLAGMSNSKVIVAINTDPEAPIFKVADYGIVGDLFEVVPLLAEQFKKVLFDNSIKQ